MDSSSGLHNFARYRALLLDKLAFAFHLSGLSTHSKAIALSEGKSENSVDSSKRFQQAHAFLEIE
eukprot:CAMPEP_0119336828 /NCGR_PEP_ID=MMETSP1333-20130426/92704_1 /TAXON_ID=418940 /ORGANISM="Scyphosphaera apsteinii, Strain RCC1455" /LENGTH=64 /DNA_ID=CAMNT_0007347711 /DNA_START=315 /DNA_END=506 /DNA_ORIENTATION=+